MSANIGLSIEGIPSFGGPPPLILSSGMLCFTPFVSIILRTEDSESDTDETGATIVTSGVDATWKEIAKTTSAIPITDTRIFRFNFE